MKIQPVQKVNAVEQVYKQMQSLLIDGTWKPGDKIPSENELSEMFGVSRVTTRQAMQKLKALGLIETRSGSGSYVRKVHLDDSLQDLLPLVYIGKTTDRQVFQFREMIDTESVLLSTPIATEEDFAKLEKIIDQMQEAANLDRAEDFSKYDLDFHIEITRITGNHLILKITLIIKDVLLTSMNSVIEKMRYQTGLDYHRKIVAAMRTRDAQAAAAIMREHIEQNYKFFV